MKKGENNQLNSLRTIQEVSDLFGVPKPTLRYYESEGLLTSQRNPHSNYRMYPLISLVELSDIILYRNLNLSIKEIKNIMQCPVEATIEALDHAAAMTENEVNRLLQTLREINQRKLRIVQYSQLRHKSMRIVDKTNVKRVTPWHMGKNGLAQEYIDNPYTKSYIIYIPDLNHPENVLEGWEVNDDSNAKEILWSAPTGDVKYVECMVRTEYAYLEVLSLHNILFAIREQGYEPIELIAEYLVSDVDPQNGKKYDYFRAWINIVRVNQK